MDAFATQDFALDHVTQVAGELVFAPTSSQSATATFTRDLAWEQGLFHVIVSITEDTTTAGCDLVVQSSSMSNPCISSLVEGVNVTTCGPAAPGDSLDVLGLECGPGSGSARFDWLTIQNGGYIFPPIVDIDATTTNMQLPSGGRMTVVRESEDLEYTFAGSDVGGFAWTTNGLEWVTAAGRWDDFDDSGDLGVWDVWGDANDVLVLVGDEGTGDGGGLYASFYGDPGDDWSLVADAVGYTTDASLLGASKKLSDCAISGEEKTEAMSSGRLLLQDAWSGDTQLYVASQNPGTRGVWLLDWDPVSKRGELCEPYADLPMDLDASGYDPLPSALATTWLPDEDEPSNPALDTHWVLVGYKAMAYQGGDRGALWLCPSVSDHGYTCTSPTSLPACERVDDVLFDEEVDVRDIEAHPTVPGLFYVADGGVRSTGVGDACALEDESSVLAVQVSWSGGVLDYAVWDTDGTNAEPSWNTDSSGTTTYPYRDADACPGAGATEGDLVPLAATGSPASMPTIALDPSGEQLFAFFPAGGRALPYGCVRTFRATDAADLPPDATLAWAPLQGYEYGAMDYATSPHAAQRRAYVDPEGAFFVDEPQLERWAPGLVHDAIFRSVGQTYDLLVAGQYLWEINHETATDLGWNSTTGDLDEVPHHLAWMGTDTFQDSVVQAVAACPGCLQDAVYTPAIDLVWAAMPDIMGAEHYGQDGSTGHPSAYRECPLEITGASGNDVETWIDPDVEGAGEAWMLLNDQVHGEDPRLQRMVLYHDGLGWCWDGYGDVARTDYTKQDASSEWYLTCSDEDVTGPFAWPACAPDDVNFAHLDDAEVGAPKRIVGVTAGVALLATAEACLEQAADPDDPCVREGGEGLWVVRATAAGLDYTEVDFDAVGTDVDGNTCTKTVFFDGRDVAGSFRDSQVNLALHPDSDPDGTGVLRVFLTSRNCGAVELDVTLGTEDTEAGTTWTAVDLSGCDMTNATYQRIRGATPSLDGGRLLVWGGTPNGQCYADPRVCAVDLTSSPTTATKAVPCDTPLQLDFVVMDLLAHPHVEDLYFFGGFKDPSCTACGAPPGLWALQRREGTSGGPGIWGFRRLSGDDLEHRRITDLAWGAGDYDRPGGEQATLDHVYMGTGGGGVWDAEVVW